MFEFSENIHKNMSLFYVQVVIFILLDWFPGWPEFNYFAKQPSDDGLSGEDCVELRQTFLFYQKQSRDTRKLYWNDRRCTDKTGFICQKLGSNDESK